jgi:hypothetical protein
MSIKIDEKWLCSDCQNPLNLEEVEQVKKLLPNNGQIEMGCDYCSSTTTADTTQCEEGYVDLNEDWVYE